MPATYAPNWTEVPCIDANGDLVTIINAGIRTRKYKAQPFGIGGIGAAQSEPIWSDFDMDAAWVGLLYNEQWAMTNVVTPVTYSVIDGSLPPGLSLSDDTPATGIISGTPTAPGVYAFTLRAVNGAGSADSPFSITVNPIPIGGFIL